MKLKALVAIGSVILIQSLIHPSAAQSSEYNGHATYLDQGWSSVTTRWWYNLSQGTAFMPYEWFLALEQPVGTELFSSPGNMQRLGFLIEPPDREYNIHGLPVGFARINLNVDRNRYACWKGDWVGFGCAACHTGQINYHGQQIRIEGGPAHHDIEGFQTELGKALAATATDSDKFARFVDRVVILARSTKAAELAGNFQCYVKSLDEDRAFVQAAQAGSTDKPTASGFGRLDAHERGVNLFLAEPIKEPKNYVPETAPVSFPALWDTPYFNWVLYNAAIRQPLARNVIEALGVGAPIIHETIFAPQVVSYVNMDNITAGQRAVMDLKSPVWPERILGTLDTAKMRRGSELYGQLCANCHQVIDRATHAPRAAYGKSDGELDIPTFNLDTIGTDPRQAATFERRKVSLEKIGGPADISSYKAGELVTGKIVNQWIDESPTNAARADEVDHGRHNEFRAPLAYRARPLNGIWATAPYLHNGSVPSLYELLLPLERRKKVFYMGNWEFNPETVGFETDSPFAGSFEYDTRLPGNSNAGHQFGTNLTDDERRALIEYLKSL
jgi:hypothetical protein